MFAEKRGQREWSSAPIGLVVDIALELGGLEFKANLRDGDSVKYRTDIEPPARVVRGLTQNLMITSAEQIMAEPSEQESTEKQAD